MAAIGERSRNMTTYATSPSALASAGVSDTSDYDNYYQYDREYIKQSVEEQVQQEIKKELLNLPSFEVVKRMHNQTKVNMFVQKRQSFNIRNAL